MAFRPTSPKFRFFGFTLIELIVVIVILGILVAAAIPKYKHVSFEGKQSATFASLTNLRSATQIYIAKQVNHDPPIIGLDGLTCSVCNGGVDPDDAITDVNLFPSFIAVVPNNDVLSEFGGSVANQAKVMVYTQSGLLQSSSAWLGASPCGGARASTGKVDESTGWLYAVEPASGSGGGGGEGFDWRINVQECVTGTEGYYDK